MAFGKIGKLGKGLTGRFAVAPEHYDITNQYYFSDGSGGYSWREIFDVLRTFYDEFITYDLINNWNEDYSGGSAAAVSDVLEIDSGAVNYNFYHNYSVYNTSDTLRNLGTITFEARVKRNNTSAKNQAIFFGLGHTHQDDDVPAVFVAFTTTSTDVEKMKGSASLTSTATFACSNNAWHTFKIILTDAATPTAKYYVDGSLKVTQNLDINYRDITYFAFFQNNTLDYAANQDLDIAYIKVRE